jgi:hypothetical protein
MTQRERKVRESVKGSFGKEWTMRHVRMGLLLVSAILLMSACGGTSANVPLAAPTPNPTAEPTVLPTPTPNLLATAGQQYLALVAPLNAQITALDKGACKTYTTNAQWHACYSKLVSLDTAFLAGFYKIVFPASMKSDVDAAISAYVKLQSLDSTLATEPAPNQDVAGYNAQRAAGADGEAALGVVRHDLGLPPLPVS